MLGTRSADYSERAKRSLPGGWLGDFQLPEELKIIGARGKGARLTDVDGREYLDLVCGGGALMLGHAPAPVVEAVCAQVALGTTFHTLNDRAIELADRLISAIPCAESVRFASSGTEATFFALRLARAFTGKEKILKFEGAYHGYHDYAMLNVSPPLTNTPLLRRPDTAGIPLPAQEQVIIAPHNDADTTCALIEKHAHELAAVIVEPVQRAIPPAPGFLERLRAITERLNVMLVFDEVVTGFRLAYGGAQELFGVIPDLAAYGKALSAGYPLSAVAGRKDVMALANPATKDSGQYVYFTGTLSGNPLCCAASIAATKELSRPGTYGKVNGMGDKFRSGLAKIFAEHDIVAQVAGMGSFFQIYFSAEPITSYWSQHRADPRMFDAFTRRMYAKNVFMSRRAKSYISTAHSEADLDFFLSAARAVCKEGFR